MPSNILPPTKSVDATEAIRQLSASIYGHWFLGNEGHTKFLIGLVPREQLPYVTMTCTVLAMGDDCLPSWANFIIGITEC